MCVCQLPPSLLPCLQKPGLSSSCSSPGPAHLGHSPSWSSSRAPKNPPEKSRNPGKGAVFSQGLLWRGRGRCSGGFSGFPSLPSCPGAPAAAAPWSNPACLRDEVMLAHPQPCVCSHPSLWRAGWDWSLLRWGWDASLAKLCPALSRDALHLDGG